jgi:hypothetical protein
MKDSIINQKEKSDLHGEEKKGVFTWVIKAI